MRMSKVLEERRKRMNPETRESVALSFRIVDRIHDILEEKGLKQKDLALRLGKSEAEISKWMRGTHNFTIDTLVSIENALRSIIHLPMSLNLWWRRSHKRQGKDRGTGNEVLQGLQ